MKLILRWNFIPLICVIIILLFSSQVNCYSKFNSQFSLKTHTDFSSLTSHWPSSLDESVAAYSRSVVCQTPECRTHEEVKNLAMCKAAKLASLLSENRKISYMETPYQGRAKNEWTKFSFVISDPQNDETIVKFGVKYVRICVPIDKSLDAWIDDRCFYDDCEGVFVFREKCKKKLPSSIQIVHDENKESKLFSRITNRVEEKYQKSLESSHSSISHIGFDNESQKGNVKVEKGRGNVPKEGGRPSK